MLDAWSQFNEIRRRGICEWSNLVGGYQKVMGCHPLKGLVLSPWKWIAFHRSGMYREVISRPPLPLEDTDFN